MTEITLIEATVKEAVQAILECPHNGNYTVLIKRRSKNRTYLQNNAMHLWCTQLATAMNDAGYFMRIVGFRPDFEIPWTMNSVKDIVRRVGDAMYERASTKDLTTIEMQQVYLVVDQRFAELSGGISIPYPSNEPPLIEEHEIK